jgi:hypothetical protein
MRGTIMSMPATLMNLFPPELRRFVASNRNVIGIGLMLLVFATLAFDYFVGFGGGPHLLGLRAVYLIEVLLWLSYVTILAIFDGTFTEVSPVRSK